MKRYLQIHRDPRFRERLDGGRDWVRRRVPPGLRLVLGLVLIVGGFLGFLPILGFWMIPLGVAIAALDVVPAWRSLNGYWRASGDLPADPGVAEHPETRPSEPPPDRGPRGERRRGSAEERV